MVNVYRYVMSTLNASVLFCLGLHMYATDAKIETSAVWKNDFIGKEADNRYRKTLSESRTGVNITEEEIKHLDGIVSPLLLKGQSIRHIFNNHSDEIMISDKTLYSYVNNSLFTARNIDMPRTVRMSPRKKQEQDIKGRQGLQKRQDL